MDDFFPKKEDLLDKLENDTKVFKNTAVKDAFAAIDRQDFIPDDYKIEAYEDYALPTLKEDTISKPTVIAFMLELLNVHKGETILDIGSGSGWTSALLAHMTGQSGKVIGMEISPELVKISRENLKKYSKLPIEIIHGSVKSKDYIVTSYHKILSTATFDHKESIPQRFFDALVIGGIMVVPIAESIWKFEKISKDDFYETEYPGFQFSPIQ